MWVVDCGVDKRVGKNGESTYTHFLAVNGKKAHSVDPQGKARDYSGLVTKMRYPRPYYDYCFLLIERNSK